MFKFTIFLLLVLTSCSHTKLWFKNLYSVSSIIVIKNNQKTDYIDQLTFLGNEYLKSPGIKKLKISQKSRRYLLSVYDRIVENSELIFNDKLKPKFHIIKNSKAFYFSLPSANFYFSSSLVKNFLKNEQLLVAALTHEIVKSHGSIYLEKTIVPTGFISTERMIALTKLPLDIKMEVNKWTFYALKRAGYDSTAYLNWLQTQNKNIIDFSFQLGLSKEISKEEFLFKNFIVNQGIIDDSVDSFGPSNSSQEFYKFLYDVGAN